MEDAIFIIREAARAWLEQHVVFTESTVAEIYPAFQQRSIVGWLLVVDGVPVTEQEVEQADV